MRRTAIIILLSAGLPLVAGCSGGGGASSTLPGVAAVDQTTANLAPLGSPAKIPATRTQAAGAAAALCVHFAKNPMCRPLPASPSVSSRSAAWASLEFQAGRDAFGGLNLSNAAIPFNDPNDDSEPLYELLPGGPTIAQTIDCDAVSWGPSFCTSMHMQGRVLNVPAGMMPEGNADHHYSYDDSTAGGEYDFWLAKRPGAPGATMHVGGAGFCAWGTAGTGCSGSTATNIATSLGGLDATALANAESSPTGTLPYAIAVAALCADPSYVYPATSSDGANTNATPACAGNTSAGGRPPEGTRWFLNLSDANVDAMSYAPYVKVILRTLDRQHFGGLIVDTNWSGAPGLSVEYHRGNYAFAAAEANVAYGTDVSLPIATPGLDLSKYVAFCTNGTC
jgi:hypothetical protein